MALLQPCGVVPGDQRCAVGFLSEKNLQWKIERSAGRREHHRCAGLRVAEDQQLCVGHMEADGAGFAGVIDESEELDVFFGEQGGEALDEFIDGVTAR